MALDPAGVAIGLPLIFFLPGYLLLRGLEPESRIRADPVRNLFLSALASVSITILWGAMLGAVPATGLGWFQGQSTGLAVLEIALAATSGALAAVAYVRSRKTAFTAGAKERHLEEREEESIRAELLRLEQRHASLLRESRRGDHRDPRSLRELEGIAVEIDSKREALGKRLYRW